MKGREKEQIIVKVIKKDALTELTSSLIHPQSSSQKDPGRGTRMKMVPGRGQGMEGGKRKILHSGSREHVARPKAPAPSWKGGDVDGGRRPPRAHW